MPSAASIDVNRHGVHPPPGPVPVEEPARGAAPRGLSGEHVIIPGEDPAGYDAILAELRRDLAPAGSVEDYLVQQMAQARWRRARIRLMEVAFLTPSLALGKILPGDLAPHEAAACVFLEDCNGAGVLLKLSRLDAAARIDFHQSLRELLSLQKARAAREPELPDDPVRASAKAVDAYLEAALTPGAVLPTLPPGLSVRLGPAQGRPKPVCADSRSIASVSCKRTPMPRAA